MSERKHYVCRGGCFGVSETPGVCQAESCADQGKSLKECDCTDERHEPENPEERED